MIKNYFLYTIIMGPYKGSPPLTTSIPIIIFFWCDYDCHDCLSFIVIVIALVIWVVLWEFFPGDICLSSLKYDDHNYYDDDDDDDDVDNNGDLESVIMVSHVLDSADDTARLPHLVSDQIIFI